MADGDSEWISSPGLEEVRVGAREVGASSEVASSSGLEPYRAAAPWRWDGGRGLGSSGRTSQQTCHTADTARDTRDAALPARAAARVVVAAIRWRGPRQRMSVAPQSCEEKTPLLQ